MERLARRDDTKEGISRSALRIWGLLFVTFGIVGRAIIQNRLLDMGNITNEQLLEAMMSSSRTMIFATAALVLQAVEVCAVPIFACLLVDGVRHTANLGKYLLRVVSLAFVSELPYNLAISGSLWDPSSRNPVFGLAFALGMLYLFRLYDGATPGKRLLRVVIVAAAVLWTMLLRVQDGAGCVILVAVLWLCRNRIQYRVFAGCIAATCCCAISPFYLAAPMGFMVVHFYRGEKGDENKIINYLAYPVLLIAAAVAAKFIG